MRSDLLWGTIVVWDRPTQMNHICSWNTSLTGLIPQQRSTKSELNHCIVLPLSWSNRVWCLCYDGCLVCNNSSSLEEGTLCKTQSTAALLELVYSRYCAIVTVFSGPLCFIYNILSRSLILHYPDPPRVGPAFIGLPPLSLSAIAVWWDLRTKSA